jgi:hypothetical protein
MVADIGGNRTGTDFLVTGTGGGPSSCELCSFSTDIIGKEVDRQWRGAGRARALHVQLHVIREVYPVEMAHLNPPVEGCASWH